MLDGVRVTVTPFGTTVCVIDTAAPLPDWASVALIVQTPGTVEAVYLTLIWPRAFVAPVAGTRIPHEPGMPAMATNCTESPPTVAVVPFLTVAVTVELLAPSAGMTLGAAASERVRGT
jgi:hypothetical protein